MWTFSNSGQIQNSEIPQLASATGAREFQRRLGAYRTQRPGRPEVSEIPKFWRNESPFFTTTHYRFAALTI